MRRCIPLFVFALVAAVGCKGTQTAGGQTSLAPPLLVGPEATSKAPPPVELPGQEKAKLCLTNAQFQEKAGRVEDAIQMYEQARATDPALAKAASRRLAVLYDQAGNFSKSAAEYESLLKSTPKDADLLTDYGYSHYCRGAWAEAEAACQKAVQANPDHKKAWVNLGLAQAQLGKWDDSFQSFCKAVREADAHSNVAFAMAAQGKTAEAKERYRVALSLDPGLRVAQAGLHNLEHPVPAGAGADSKPTTPLDPASAAARVPGVAEIDARLKKTESGTFVIMPPSYGQTQNP